MFNIFKTKNGSLSFNVMTLLRMSSTLQSFSDDLTACDFYDTLDDEDRKETGEFHDVRITDINSGKFETYSYNEFYKMLVRKTKEYVKRYPEDKEKTLAYLEEYKKKANIN